MTSIAVHPATAIGISSAGRIPCRRAVVEDDLMSAAGTGDEAEIPALEDDVRGLDGHDRLPCSRFDGSERGDDAVGDGSVSCR